MKKAVSLTLMLVLLLGTLLMPTACADENPIMINISYDKEYMDLGDTITATYEVTGGSGVYTDIKLRWNVGGSGAGTGWVREIHVTETAGTISYTPVSGSYVYLRVDVRDSAGDTQWDTGGLVFFHNAGYFVIQGTNAGELLSVKVSANKEKLQPGETVTINYEVTGGTGLYTDIYIYIYTYTDVHYTIEQEPECKYAVV